MSGYTKHIFMKDLRKINSDLTRFVKSIIPLLPYSYNFDTINLLLKRFYPYELFIINEKYEYYCSKERYLQAVGKKSRFKMATPSNLIRKLPIYKKISTSEYIQQHQKNYDEITQKEEENKLAITRNPKIKKICDKIKKSKAKAQQVEPAFLDALMGLYDRKNTTQKDKVYIFVELQKYFCSKTIRFFYKKIDTEYNRQLREMACKHLQSLGFQPKLGRQKYIRIPSRNKKRREYLKNTYAYESYAIQGIPEELEYRLENSKEQRIKSYDFFISHSSTDYAEVQSLLEYLNRDGKNVYCDWIADKDYLKRQLLGKETLAVIKKRIQQSNAVIFVVSDKSVSSNWCKYELNYAHGLGKCIYAIPKDHILNCNFEYNKVIDTWFIDPAYEDLALWE